MMTKDNWEEVVLSLPLPRISSPRFVAASTTVCFFWHGMPPNNKEPITRNRSASIRVQIFHDWTFRYYETFSVETNKHIHVLKITKVTKYLNKKGLFFGRKRKIVHHILADSFSSTEVAGDWLKPRKAKAACSLLQQFSSNYFNLRTCTFARWDHKIIKI